MGAWRGYHIAARAPVVQAGSKACPHGQRRVITTEIVVGTASAGQASPGLRELPVLSLQLMNATASHHGDTVSGLITWKLEHLLTACPTNLLWLL